MDFTDHRVSAAALRQRIDEAVGEIAVFFPTAGILPAVAAE